MAEYINRQDLIKFLDNIQQLKMPITEGFKYITIDGAIKVVSERPNADVVERSTMGILCNEYLSKCKCCDECCAEYFCIENQLRTEKRDCVNNLITYFAKRNIGE